MVAPPGSIQGFGSNSIPSTNGGYSGSQPAGANGHSGTGPAVQTNGSIGSPGAGALVAYTGGGGPGSYGPPPKDKPKMGDIVKDNMDVAIAKTFRTAHKDVDIAIIKATTSKFSVVPKEKHVRTLKMHVRGGHTTMPGSHAGYVITKLMERLHKSSNWLKTLKTLMVFHRLMRETEGVSFVAELCRYGGMAHGHRGGALNMDNFLDDSSSEGRFDYSEWVRSYARYLDEQLEVYSKIAFYQEAEGAAPAESKMRNLPPEELLAQLPPLQRLLERLVDAMPRGVAARHYVCQAALLTVAKESFQPSFLNWSAQEPGLLVLQHICIYRAISEGIINLADCFFDMGYSEASKGLDIYKQHTVDNDKLGAYYAQAEQIEELRRSATFPKLTPPSPDFLDMMEEYVAQAPRDVDDGPSGRSPLRKGRNAPKEQPSGELPPPIDSGLSGVIHPKEEEEEEKPPTPSAPEPEPEIDLLNFDEPEVAAPPPEPPREKTATELLEEEAAAAAASAQNTPSAQNGAAPQGGFGGPVPQQSNNPFGEGAAFGQQQGQQQQQQASGGFPAGSMVPYGQNFGGPGYGQQQPYGYAPYGQPQQYGYGQPGGYGGQQYGYGGAPVQPGAMVPGHGVGSPGYGSPGFGAPSPAGSFNQSPAPFPNNTPGKGTSNVHQSQSFKDAALSDPFADLGPIAPPQTQTTPPLREVSPTQQRINLGAGARPQPYGVPQQQWQQQAPQVHPQQAQAPPPQQGSQQQQQTGWAQQGFASFPAHGGQAVPSPITPPGGSGSNRW